MYMDKELTRGYNVYITAGEGIGAQVMMDVAMLILEPGDSYSFDEPDKEPRCCFRARARSRGTARKSPPSARTRSTITRGACTSAAKHASPSRRQSLRASTFKRRKTSAPSPISSTPPTIPTPGPAATTAS